jgi:hypothetical protein
MLKKTVWAAALALAASGSFAASPADAETSWMTEVRSVLTRAEVAADLAEARAGDLFKALGDEWYFYLKRGTVTVRLVDGTEMPVVELTRADVTDALMRAKQSGEYASLNAEAHDFWADRRVS